MQTPHPTPGAGMDRRDFLKTVSVAGAGLALGSTKLFAGDSTAKRRRYAIVGLGSRHIMYQDAIERDYRDHAELVALCDLNPGRLKVAQVRSGHNGAPAPRGYLHTDFAKMIAETKPDAVIVTTVDATHVDYLVATLDAGVDAITEKPMTTDAEKC